MVLKEEPTARPAPEPTTVSHTPARSVPPVLWWAGIGVVFLGVEAYSIVRWIANGHAKSTPDGPDPIPDWVKVSVRLNELAMVLLAVVALVYVVRQCRRQRTLTFDAIVMIVWFTAWWQDPLMNYVRPMIFYNTYTFNLGSWTSDVPGWVSPNGHLVPEPYFFTGGVYAWLMFTAVVTCAFMRWVKRRRPGIGDVALCLVAWLSMAAFCTAVELIWIRSKVYAYGTTIHELTFFPGSEYQYPGYVAVFFGGVMASVGVLRYYMDDRGRSYVEKGVDQLKVGRTRKHGLRVFAIAGFVNASFLLLFVVPMQWFTMHADKMPDHHSWMRDGVCGEGTPYECPGPGVPIYLDGQRVR